MSELSRAQNLTLNRHHYPDPFLDFASTVLPKSQQKLLELCRVFGMTHPQIAPIVRKYAQYPLTHIIVRNASSSQMTQWWKKALQEDLQIVEFAESVGLDFFTYGSAYVTSVRPFQRTYTCTNPDCNFVHDATVKRLLYEIKDKKFWCKCDNCKRYVELIAKDQPLHRVQGLRLVRLSPTEMTPRRNPLTGEVYHSCSPPALLKRAVRGQPFDRKLIDTTPLEFVKAAINNAKILFEPGAILHLMEPAPSGTDFDFGMPRILPALKTAYLDQLYKKSDESGALERTLPARFVYPNPTSNNPFKTISLAQFHRFIAMSLRRWRQDKNAIMASPFPVGVAEIGNDAQRYDTVPQRQEARREIVAALGAPEGFLSEQMNWSGGSIQLRMLENTLMPYVRALDRMVEFAVREVCAVTQSQPVEAVFKPFRMVDDIQQLQLLISLAERQQVSWQEVLDRMGLDWEVEHKKVRRETTIKLDLQVMQQTVSARAALVGLAIESRAQSHAKGWDDLAKGQMATGEKARLALTHQVSPQVFDMQQAKADEEQAREESQQAGVAEQAARNKVRLDGAKADKLESEADKLSEHAQFYEDQQQRNDDVYKAKAIESHVERILSSPPAQARQILSELMEASPELGALVQEEIVARTRSGAPAGAQAAAPDAASRLEQLRAESKSPKDLANKLLMQRPKERMELLDALINTDPDMAQRVVENLGLGGASSGGSGPSALAPVRPLPNKLPPRRSGL